MRRSSLLAIAVLVAGAMLGVPTLSRAQAPTGDAVTGQATDCLPGPVPGSCFSSIGLSVDARSDPDGANPNGRVGWFDNGGSPDSTISTSTEVTCLSVSGNVAIIGVTGTSSFFGTEFPTAGLVRVADRGGPDSGQDTFAFATQSGGPSDPPLPGPTVCSSFPAGASDAVNEFGDLTVIDAPATPSSKDQCKNGGWRTFGTFRNQGQCVALVERRVKPAP